MNLATLKNNKHLRNVLILALATAIAVVAATAAVLTQERGVRVKFKPEPLYDKLFTRIVQNAPAPIGLGQG